jgi:hypothetical protein
VQPRVVQGVEDGEMDQVDGVRQHADEPYPAEVEQPEHAPVVPAHGDDEHGNERHPLERVPQALLELRMADQKGRQQRDEAKREIDLPPPAIGGRVVPAEHGIPAHGQHGAEEDGIHAGVGRHIGAIVGCVEAEDQEASPRQHRSAEGGEHQELPTRRGKVAPQQQIQEREDEIEVLLDGERPVDRRAGRSSHPPPGLDHLIVAHVEELRHHPVESNHLTRDDAGQGEQGCQTQHKVEGGQQPQRTTQIEAAQVDAPRPLELHPQESGDQEAAQEEEDGDAELAGNELAEPEVGGHHDGDGDGTEAVEGRNVHAGPVLSSRHRCPPARASPLSHLPGTAAA